MLSIWTAWSSTSPILAQVNIGSGFSVLMSIVLIVSGIGLYAIRVTRPNLARDHDIIFVAFAVVCAGVLFFNGWRLDPILQFNQLLMTGSVVWFAFEAIRLRGITTEQAKRSSSAPITDEERPVSRVYRAELDDLPPLDERAKRRRIRGDVRGDDYEDVRRRSSRSSSSDRPRRPRSSRPLPPDRSTISDGWDDDFDDDTPRRSAPRSSFEDDRPAPPRRSRPPSSSRRRDVGSDPSSDYVDYQPIDFPDDKPRDFE